MATFTFPSYYGTKNRDVVPEHKSNVRIEGISSIHNSGITNTMKICKQDRFEERRFYNTNIGDQLTSIPWIIKKLINNTVVVSGHYVNCL